ncbi:MAG: hypothetical protein KZQ94_07485 [Candidatus Thiodiazotropha sp. (ex Troendleina suluensis)]|nr:hypothetical protein [Candidatus Thiodiazotropha sp. (ex Troendleina suluensis)]
MKWNKGLLGAVVAGLVHSAPVCAYKAMTHQAITNHVASRTILSNEELMVGMGFDVIVPEDVNGLLVTTEKDTDCNTPKRDKNIKHFYCGAALEDIGIRSFNHFLDPVRGLPLHRLGVPMPGFSRSPDWALEDQPDENSAPYNFTGQAYSLRDAVDYFFKSKSSASQDLRNENEQKLFLALGHVVHHLQDMAQPAHVRNDMHCDAKVDRMTRCLGYLAHDPSFYERYTDDEYDILPLTGYADLDLNTFRKARDFWKTGGQWQGVGMAEFANWNFVSQDTNFVYVYNPVFPTDQLKLYPSLFYDNPVPEPLGTGNEIPGETGEVLGTQWFIGNQVTDRYRPEQSGFNAQASTLSIFHNDLQEYELLQHPENTLELNTKTFAAARPFLIPRAVAYSAGLVNYFFRGQMRVKSARVYDIGSTATESLGIAIVNATSDHTPGNAPFTFSEGRFTLHYETIQGTRRYATPYDREEVELSQTNILRDQGEKHLTFQLLTDLWDRSKPMTLIFKGKIGEESGIAVKEFNPDPLLAFNVEGYTGDSPVPNNINVYASYDLGFTWSYKGGAALPISDSTLTDDNRLLVHHAMNLGEGELLAHTGYIDYRDEQGDLFNTTSADTMLHSTDYGQSWEIIDFEWLPLLNGSANVSDVFSIYRSFVFTGDQGLAGVRIQHPAEEDPPGTPRSFQLFQSNGLGATGSWIGRLSLGTGGLPEVDYLGNSSYAFASILEGNHAGTGVEGGDFRFDSILMRTDDGGNSFYQLSDFATECGDPHDPDNKVYACLQHLEYLGDDRLLGWARVSADELDDYQGYVPFHLSHDGGMSWFYANKDAPFDQSCESFSVWEGQVKDVIYIGKSPEDKDVMIALTQCVEVFEDSSSSPPIVNRGPVTGESLFFTRDGGANWNKVRLPTGHNQDGIILYAGDNGAIPGLYYPEN